MPYENKTFKNISNFHSDQTCSFRLSPSYYNPRPTKWK